MTDVPEDVACDFPHFDLAILTERQLEVVVMRCSSGLSWREIGRLLGRDESSARERFAAATIKLRAVYPRT
jgi:DNA-directed RNA polymerase specialized sigma24 family protein